MKTEQVTVDSEKTDLELIEDIQDSGNELSMGVLVKRYTGLVRSICTRRFGGNTTMVDDAVQTVFLVLWRRIGGLSRNVNLAGWFTLAARNVTLQTIRSDARRVRLESDFGRELDPNGFSTDDRWSEAKEVLDDALLEVSERRREVLMRHYFMDETFERIAVSLNRSSGAVRNMARLARMDLLSVLRKKGVVLTLATLVAGLERESAEAASLQSMTTCTPWPAENAGEEVRSVADAVMAEMDRAAARAMWWKVGGVAAGLATIGVGTALVVNYLQPVQVPSDATTVWRIESVTGAATARRGETVLTLKAGDPLCMGDTIVTFSNQEAVVVLDDGVRILLREEGEVGFERRTLNTEHRTSKSEEGYQQFRVLKGSIVAQVKRPTSFATPHAAMETDGADFFLMVASGLTTNGAPWSFSRVDVTEGLAKFLPSSISNLRSEIPLVARQTVCAGTDRVGRPIKTLARKSDGREMSPKYGGIVFREYAELYDSRESGLHAMRFREGPVLLETNAWQMADKVIVKGDLRVAPGVAKTGEKGLGFETGATGRGGGIFPLGLPTADVFEIRVEYAFAGTFKKEGRFDIAVYPVDLVRLPIHSLPRNGRNIPSGENEGDLWGVYRMKFLRIGAAPEGQPVYETDLLDTLTDIIVTHTTVLDTEKWGPSMFVQWMRIRVGAIRIVELCEERRLR